MCFREINSVSGFFHPGRVAGCSLPLFQWSVECNVSGMRKRPQPKVVNHTTKINGKNSTCKSLRFSYHSLPLKLQKWKQEQQPQVRDKNNNLNSSNRSLLRDIMTQGRKLLTLPRFCKLLLLDTKAYAFLTTDDWLPELNLQGHCLNCPKFHTKFIFVVTSTGSLPCASIDDQKSNVRLQFLHYTCLRPSYDPIFLHWYLKAVMHLLFWFF